MLPHPTGPLRRVGPRLCPSFAARARRLAMAASLVWGAATADAAEIYQASQHYTSGQYAQCVELASQAIGDREYSETWRTLKLQAEMALGRYTDARATLEQALERYTTSVRLRWLGHEVYLHNGDPAAAARMLDEIGQLLQRTPWRYTDPVNHVIVGRYMLSQGVDPKDVLEQVYNRIKQRHPDYVDTYLASGQLALEKHDHALAAESLQQAAKLNPTDADVCFGLARAYASSDPREAQKWLTSALEHNANHIDSLHFLVDRHVDAERYTEAETLLDRVGRINPKHPVTLAYRAVLAHLENDPEQETRLRLEALSSWATNPEVDHLIGRKLSQKYRFAEGARYQRRSLQLDGDYLPAKIQLCQDLLRLGQEEEGWRLADEVYKQDAYNVVAHNLVTLQEHLLQFDTLERGGLVVRMDSREARIYGDRVLQLLERAKQVLCAKYDVPIVEPVIVELFPRQQDFAIRTFGLPGGAGFLGVCFGRVITANSPASQAETPANWQAVLWHEFCHVVTLQKTNNKMPRWLSEGISVYEERQADPTWGQAMTPTYREMLLSDELTPVSQLSGAFLNPPSPVHLQFAYFQSALVVEYLVQKYGLDTLKRLLIDLGAGMPINDSLQRYAGSLPALDQEFAEYARQRARQFAPDADWRKPEVPLESDAELLEAWNSLHPDSFWGLQARASQLLRRKQWQAAKQPLERLLELCPDHAATGNAYRSLATVYRQLEETEQERAVLEKLASLQGDALDVYVRLMELGAAREDWPAVMRNAQRAMAVNPLQKVVHRHLGMAAEPLGDRARMIQSYQALLLMDPVDPAETHYRLAKMLHETGDTASAKRHVLQALEEAPRFRDAHRLLLEIAGADPEHAEQQPVAALEQTSGKEQTP